MNMPRQAPLRSPKKGGKKKKGLVHLCLVKSVKLLDSTYDTSNVHHKRKKQHYVTAACLIFAMYCIYLQISSGMTETNFIRT